MLTLSFLYCIHSHPPPISSCTWLVVLTLKDKLGNATYREVGSAFIRGVWGSTMFSVSSMEPETSGNDEELQASSRGLWLCCGGGGEEGDVPH